jgi:hypothetical protein
MAGTIDRKNDTTVDVATVERAKVDPASVFASPADVVSSPLDRTVKIDILRRWEYDARELQVADAEGMQGGERADALLDRVVAALHELGADATFQSDSD